MDAYKQQCEFLVKTEEELRSQLTTYRDKFDGFQQMLTQSHDAFTSFKVRAPPPPPRKLPSLPLCGGVHAAVPECTRVCGLKRRWTWTRWYAASTPGASDMLDGLPDVLPTSGDGAVLYGAGAGAQ